MHGKEAARQAWVMVKGIYSGVSIIHYSDCTIELMMQ